MSSDNSTVATETDFAPTVVGGTDRERSIASSAPRAHDGTSQQPRPEDHQTQLNVLGYDFQAFYVVGRIYTHWSRAVIFVATANQRAKRSTDAGRSVLLQSAPAQP